jgi:hypothetical protein
MGRGASPLASNIIRQFERLNLSAFEIIEVQPWKVLQQRHGGLAISVLGGRDQLQ